MAAQTPAMKGGVWHEIGLGPCRPFHRDSQFWAAILAAMVLWLLAAVTVPQLLPRGIVAEIMLLLSVIVWQPLLEELLFRGVVQGQLMQRAWAQVSWLGLSRANLLTSAAFALMHLWYHAPAWAAAVLVPSLIFGYFRERYASIWPGLILHVYYNAGYFLIGAFI